MSALAFRAADPLARALPGRACDVFALAAADVAWALRVPTRGTLAHAPSRGAL